MCLNNEVLDKKKLKLAIRWASKSKEKTLKKKLWLEIAKYLIKINAE